MESEGKPWSHHQWTLPRTEGWVGPEPPLLTEMQTIIFKQRQKSLQAAEVLQKQSMVIGSDTVLPSRANGAVSTLLKTIDARR